MTIEAREQLSNFSFSLEQLLPPPTAVMESPAPTSQDSTPPPPPPQEPPVFDRQIKMIRPPANAPAIGSVPQHTSSPPHPTDRWLLISNGKFYS